MKSILAELVGLGLLLFSAAASAETATSPAQNAFFSPDQYRLTHSMFDQLRADLYQAQTDAYPDDLAANPRFNAAHSQLGALERKWDQGEFDSLEMAKTISALQLIVNDNRLMPRDRDALSADLSRLLQFQTDYY